VQAYAVSWFRFLLLFPFIKLFGTDIFERPNSAAIPSSLKPKKSSPVISAKSPLQTAEDVGIRTSKRVMINTMHVHSQSSVLLFFVLKQIIEFFILVNVRCSTVDLANRLSVCGFQLLLKLSQTRTMP
jgi:hypothetical protein